MKHLETQTQKEQRERKRSRYLGFFLLILMVLSTAGYAILSYSSTAPPPSPTTDAYGRSPLTVNGQTLYLTYSATEVANTSLNITSSLREYIGNSLYLSAENPTTVYEISSTLGRFASKIQEACYGSCQKNLPEKNCSQPFIIIMENSVDCATRFQNSPDREFDTKSNKTNQILCNETESSEVRQEDQCIFITGDLRAVDAFLYHIFRTP